ncbi:unnamed protein product [Coffea canephora]|uniref:LOB domain-containing protein n=1 Tax=Coffea canephora TaxID=49390 RepID=A0A068U2S4_COFCA|nr:unnamed protein product [Coffea canephora]
MSSSNSPCAACKCLRRKCTQECVFAPYFPPDQPQKFINVHRVFGASNVAKLLNELGTGQREDAVNSLAYEAEYRLRDPVYGCVGLISILQQKLKQVQHDLNNAKKELATYIGPSAMLPIFQHPGFMQQHPNNPSASTVMPYAMQPMMGLPTGVAAPHGGPLIIRDAQQQQQMYEAQQYAAAVAARDQEMFRAYEQQQQQQPPPQELMRFNSGFEGAGPAAATAFNTMSCGAAMSPSLALGSYEAFQLESQLMLQQQQPQQLPLQSHHQPQAAQQQHPQRAKSEEGRSVGPSC